MKRKVFLFIAMLACLALPLGHLAAQDDAPAAASPPQTFPFHIIDASHDAYVHSGQNKTVFNTPRLKVADSVTDMNAYLRFDVSELSGQVVTQATFSIRAVQLYGDYGRVYKTKPYYRGTTQLWQESGLTWRNAPRILGTPLGSLECVSSCNGGVYWVQLDVTEAVAAAADAGKTEFSLAITSDSPAILVFHSREGISYPNLQVWTEQ